MCFGRQIKPNPNEFFSFQDLRNEQCAYDQDGDESVGSRHDAQVGMQGERYGAVVVGVSTGSRVSKTGATVQNRNNSKKNDFCIFGFKNIKYKKSDPVYRPGPDRKRKKKSENRWFRPVFETLTGSVACHLFHFCKLGRRCCE